jgi:predicted ester cyclase
MALGLIAACGGSAPPKKVVKPVVVEAPKPPPPPPPDPLATEERVKVHDGCLADFVAEVPESFTRCYSVDSKQTLMDAGEPAHGTPAIAAATRPMWESFKLQGETRMVVANGDRVLTIALYRGAHDGAPWMGLSASGKVFGVFAAEVMTLDEQGKHGDVRMYMDLATMLAQLGGGPRGQAFRKPYDVTGREAYSAIATGSEAETANIAAVQAALDLFNKKDWKGLTASYTSDAAISEQAAPADIEGSRAIGKYFAELGKGFPDVQIAVDALWGAGDFVIAETTFTGTNNGPLPMMGIKKATRKPVTLHQAHVFRMDGGKVLQHWIFANGMSAGIQLGLVQPPAPPAGDAPATP